jgi:class 3 adenylate cyclase
MSDALTLPAATFERVAPFHLLWDAAGRLVSSGMALRRFWSCAGDIDAQRLRLVRPFAAPLEPRLFDDLTDMALAIAHADAPGRELRGELFPTGDGRWLLACRPEVRRLTELDALGLKLSDLPIHYGLGDALLAGEAAQVSLDESREALLQLERANEALQQTNEAFSRFVPRPFLTALGVESPGDAHLGVHAGMAATVMFADLRNFTSISERMAPAATFGLINRYLALVAPRIRDNGGFVVHYLGDGIMALFEGPPDNAVRAAIAMQETLRAAIASGDFFSSLPRDVDLRVGIGLHFGHLELGIVGETGRWDSSIISDAVNTAARVEGLTKGFGARILVSEALRERLDATTGARLRRIGRMQVKGRREPIVVFEVLDGVEPHLRDALISSRERFEAAVDAGEAGDRETARARFRAQLDEVPGDRAAQKYLEDLAASAT